LVPSISSEEDSLPNRKKNYIGGVKKKQLDKSKILVELMDIHALKEAW
jgi:hypothetical protein